MGWNLKKIPRIAHFYWGNKYLPLARYLAVASFSAYNPEWDIRLHCPDILSDNIGRSWNTPEHVGAEDRDDGECYWGNVERLGNVTIERHDLCDMGDLSEVHRSDYLRWELLYNIGGLWSDMDILYFRSMDECNFNDIISPDSWHKDPQTATEVVCYWPDPGGGDCSNSVGFILCEPSSRVFGAVLKLCRDMRAEERVKGYQSIGRFVVDRIISAPDNELMSTGGDQVILSKLDESDTIVNAKSGIVYPYSWVNIATALMKTSAYRSLVQDITIGIHWYGGDAMVGAYMRRLTEDTMGEGTECVLSQLLKYLKESKGNYLFPSAI